MKEKPNLYKQAADCSGCAACATICPVSAITFKYNAEGFLYPQVDDSKCVRCLMCESVCAYKKDTQMPISERECTHIYAAKSRNPDVLFQSSSGGIFTVLSDFFFEQNNAVVSCVYSYENDTVLFAFLNDETVRDKARGSKYIQAEVGDAFQNIIKWIVDNPDRSMLVVGTGCQMAGLDLLLKEKKIRDHVILVDLICHGAASSKLWKNFIHKIEYENGGHIDYITFKNKRNGWESPSVFAKIKDKELSIKPYADWFYMGWSLRESCYNCPYTRIDRNSDITIGDFWGIQNVMPDFYDKMGVSLVITHNENGENLFDSIKDKINYRESNRKDCLQPRLCTPQSKPKNRDKFWYDMNKRGIEYCEKKYCEHYDTPFTARIKKIIKQIMNDMYNKGID